MAAGATKKPNERVRAGERGAVLVIFVLFLVPAIGLMAFVIDAGYAWGVKRHLQASADAAALAAAMDLPDPATANLTAFEYSASTGGKNERASTSVTTTVCFPQGSPSESHPCLSAADVVSADRVKVTQRADGTIFFAGVFGFASGDFDVEASAVASRKSTTSGTPIAVYVHELCGASTGNKGLQVNGKNALIEGTIHVNGQFTIGDSGFRAVGQAGVYRPSAGSPPEPGKTQGTCDGAAPIHVQDKPDSTYCTGCPPPAPLSDPAPVPYRDWITPYHTEAIMKAATPCTDTTTIKLHNQTIPVPTVYCPSGGKFEIDMNVTGNITVIAKEIVVNGVGSQLKPANANHPVLFYSTEKELKVNPSGAFDWEGYIINRFGGIEINSGGVVSPRKGLLEAEWIIANGQDFTMLGTAPDSTGGTIFGGVLLEE